MGIPEAHSWAQNKGLVETGCLQQEGGGIQVIVFFNTKVRVIMHGDST